MNWSKHHRGSGRGKSRRSYHHGNLREALIEAALDLIADKGPAGFTFAEAARAAGVSPAAPYRHFADRDALMADVARRGFERLEAVLSKAWDDGRPSPMSAFQNVGRAYLAFAADEPAYYAAMFETGLPPDLDPQLAQAGDLAFNVMRTACEAISATMPADRRPPAMMMSLHIWALAHGIASLFARGDAARRPLPMPPEDLLEAGVLIYLEGLGLRDDGKSAENR
jgi:AcrR family transcriptional regulator